jgi:hypothetical protein
LEANNKAELYCYNDVFKTQIQNSRYMIIWSHSKIRNHKQYSLQKIKFKHLVDQLWIADWIWTHWGFSSAFLLR